MPWSEARDDTYDLIVAASPKGDLELLRGPHVLLPHGAGFNKAIPSEGSADSASGLDPAFLRRIHDHVPVAQLATQLPYDQHQLALIFPPNERSPLGTYELAERHARVASPPASVPTARAARRRWTARACLFAGLMS